MREIVRVAMRPFIVALVAVSLFAGCVTVGSTLSVTCASLGGAHQGFLAYAAEHPIKPSTMAIEQRFFDEGQALCADRGTLTTAAALTRIAFAAAEIGRMLWEAEKRTGVPATP